MSLEHFFRQSYGRLVPMLARRVGIQHLALVEDAVQSALMTALTTWTTSGNEPPRDPEAWVYTVARNQVIQDLRQEVRRNRLLGRLASSALGSDDHQEPAEAFFEDEIRDDMLRMLFACCDESIPQESQLVLALKTLCGFSTSEIALRLFTSEANVHKRLGRARDRLRALGASAVTGDPSLSPLDTLRARLPNVHGVLYLLFNEGYLSAREETEQAIRLELCEEAVRLATLLAEHPAGASPESAALLAMMHLHAARFESRTDLASGGLLLLEEQDRSRWDRNRIEQGLAWLARSATGDVFSRFHAEAGIAAEHCLAPSFRETRWSEVVDLYALLEHAAPSPFHTLNRAVAIAELQGPDAALAMLHNAHVVAPPTSSATQATSSAAPTAHANPTTTTSSPTQTAAHANPTTTTSSATQTAAHANPATTTSSPTQTAAHANPTTTTLSATQTSATAATTCQPKLLAGSYLWDAVLSDLHRRAGHNEIALKHRNRALESAPTSAVRTLLARRLQIAPLSPLL